MTHPQNDHEQSCGTVAVIGVPNAGKSTLVNQMVGAKVSIVSPKVQTTRNRVLGIFIENKTQIILIDTPGLFEPKSRLDRAMVSAAWGGTEGADFILYIFDARRGYPNPEDETILKKLKNFSQSMPVYLVLNKIDAVKPDKLLVLTDRLNKDFAFTKTYMISALNGDGVSDLRRDLALGMPKSPWLFEEDQMTDLPMRLLAAEITREQIFNQLHQEVPYSITVETEEWENFDNGQIKIRQVIHVERDSQKGIVVGKGGSRLKEIGSQSRRELEDILATKVHLNLFVRVSEKWREDPEYFSAWGLDHKA
jgi:GTP-binding protein Era